MGSRAIAVVCRDADVAHERFGVETGETGAMYTRTGRPFLDDLADTEAVLSRVRAAVDAAGLWDELGTGWLSSRSPSPPPVRGGRHGRAALAGATASLETAAARGIEVGDRLESQRGRAEHVERDHLWHVGLIDRLVDADPEWVVRTDRRVVDVTHKSSQAAATAWWEEMTAGGGGGMVVKPLSFVARGRRGLVQPGVKCRGREYLRLIYGPEYVDSGQIDRLRSRGLGRKRSLAVREFGLGVEALERFVRREPLHRIHECVFGVLALESEPVDPRL